MSKYIDLGLGGKSFFNQFRELIISMLSAGDSKKAIANEIEQLGGVEIELAALSSFIHRTFKLKIKPVSLTDYKDDIFSMADNSSNGDIARYLTKKMGKKISAYQVKAFVKRQQPEILAKRLEGGLLTLAWTKQGLQELAA